jgi:cell filamentation protein
MSKISIRFSDVHEVRAVWNNERSKWWFSVLGTVVVLRNESDYEQNQNYWKYLKGVDYSYYYNQEDDIMGGAE